MNLTTLSIESLYQLNAPMRRKLDARQPLSVDEAALHETICAEVLIRLDAQRLADRNERDARLSQRYHRPACEIALDEAASLNGFYSGVEA